MAQGKAIATLETMRTNNRWNVVGTLAVVAVAAGGCAHKQLDTGSLDEVERLAIVARVTADPQVEAARVDPREGRAYPTATPEEADQALAAELKKQVSSFELEERLRSAIVGRLPATPPWSNAMPSVEVATALDALLVEDRSGPPDYEALLAHGSNAVLEIEIERFGLHRVGTKTGLYLEGRGRLFKIEGGTLWKAPIKFDDARALEGESLDVVALRKGGYRDALIDLIGRVGETVAQELRGEQGR